MSATKPGAYEWDKACAGLMIYEYPSMRLVHEQTEIVTLKHPYIAGFLAFREVNPLIKLVNNVRKKKPEFTPDIILVDGNGILHYRRVGLATHLSMEVKIPCIGIAKRLLAIDNLNVDYLVPHLNKKLKKIGMFWKIHGYNKEEVGYALRTQENDDVVYVSPGNLIGFESSLKIVMLCLDKQRRYKCPIPVEKADFVTRKIIYRYQKTHKNPYAYDEKNDDSKKKQKCGKRNHFQLKNNAKQIIKSHYPKRSIEKQKTKPVKQNKKKAKSVKSGSNSNAVNKNNHINKSTNMSKSAKRRQRKKQHQASEQVVKENAELSKAAKRKLRRKQAKNAA